MNLIYSSNFKSEFNLACEELLFKGNDQVVFLYINEPTVVLGANQNWEYEVDPTFCHENNIQIRRRISGGGTVYHDTDNLNYSFITDKNQDQLSDAFLDPIITALSKIGINTIKGKRKDLWVDKNGKLYKISGTASHISKGRKLQHGTLLFKSDLDQLRKATNSMKEGKTAVPSVRSEVINLSEFLTEYDTESFYSKFIDTLSVVLSIDKILTLEDYILNHTGLFNTLKDLISKNRDPNFIFRR